MSFMESPIWFVLFVALLYLTFLDKDRKRKLFNVQNTNKYKKKIKKQSKNDNVEQFDGVGKGFGTYYPPTNKYCENKVFPGSYLTPYDMSRSRDCECAKVCNNNTAQTPKNFRVTGECVR